MDVINDDRNISSSTSRPYFIISPVVGSMISGTCISYHPSLELHGLLGVDDDETVELFDDDMATYICLNDVLVILDVEICSENVPETDTSTRFTLQQE